MSVGCSESLVKVGRGEGPVIPMKTAIQITCCETLETSTYPALEITVGEITGKNTAIGVPVRGITRPLSTHLVFRPQRSW